MNCKQIQPLLPEFAGGEAGPKERAACEEHLRGCAACRARHQGLVQVVTLLRSAGEHAAPPAGFAASLHQRLAQSPPPTRESWLAALLEKLQRPAAMGLGAAAVAAVLLVVLLRGAPGASDALPLATGSVVSEEAAPFQVPQRRVAVVHLEFLTDVVVDDVQFDVQLPSGLAFVSNGKPLPGESLQWRGSLAAGANPIPLAISGTRPGRYHIVARARAKGLDVTHDVYLEVVPS